MKKLTEKQREEIVQRVAAGERYADVAESYGVTSGAVSSVLRSKRMETMERRAGGRMMLDHKRLGCAHRLIGILEAASAINKDENLIWLLNEAVTLAVEVASVD